MALSARTKLGSYEVLGPIGAGGMGEVYRTQDTKLEREVAIKVLLDCLKIGDEPGLLLSQQVEPVRKVRGLCPAVRCIQPRISRRRWPPPSVEGWRT